MAGESAREHAQRAREKAERLQRYADQWEKGADGEAATAAALSGLSSEWTVLHDIRWPGRTRANIDHVAIGPPGIFVIDSKNWSGRVSVQDDVLLQNGRRREQAVAAAAEAALAVASRVPDLADRVVPALCFIRDEKIAGRSRGVLLCSTASIELMLASHAAVWDAHDVRKAAERMGAIGRRTEPVRRPAAARREHPTGDPERVRGRRRSGVLRRVIGGVVLWFLACCVAAVALGPTARATDSPELLVGAYAFLGLMTISTMSRRRRRRRPT